MEFEVYYNLSGMVVISAIKAVEASDSVFAFLHGLVGKIGVEGLTVDEAKQVGLTEALVDIGQIRPLPHREFFAITSLARDDLEELGFDASQVSDEDMGQLARKMADDYFEKLYWRSMKKRAESLGIPKLPPKATSVDPDEPPF